MRMEDVRQNRLHDDLVDLWPLVSPPEDYAEEATLRPPTILARPSSSWASAARGRREARAQGRRGLSRRGEEGQG